MERVFALSVLSVNLLRFGASVLKVHGTSEPIDSFRKLRLQLQARREKVHSLCHGNFVKHTEATR